MKEVQRQSNFELLRIVAMAVIVAHHYVVNSTVMDQFFAVGGCVNYLFLKLIGAWGKTAINPFVMISGLSVLTARRFLKIFLEWMLYSFVVYGALLVFGFERCSLTRLFDLFFEPFRYVDVGFTQSFVWFYLGIPFYNLIIKHTDRKRLWLLTGGLLSLFVLPITFFRNGAVFHHVFWYMTLYFVGACIRLYPLEWMGRNKVAVLLLFGGIAVASGAIFGRIVYPCFITKALGVVASVHESSTLFAFVIGAAMFLTFKNMRIGYLPVVNKVASCMFGVLCIHAASDAMRVWLWRIICRVPDYAHASLGVLALHATCCIVSIIVVCCLIDLVRQRWIEKPFFNRFVNV